MRVTDASASMRSLAGLQSSASRLAGLQAKLSSGRQITRPSDDPSGTARALQLRGDLRRNEQYSANAGDAIGWMSNADSAYSRIVTLAQSARTLMVQGLNTGAMTPSAENALADQVDALRSQMISVANTTYNSRPVFGGTTAGPIAYDSAGNYVGDAGVVQRDVGAQATVQINQTGTQVFGAPGSDMFSLLSTISSTLRTAPSTLAPQLSALDAAIGTVGTAQATEGATYQRVQATQTAEGVSATTLTTQLSNIEDIDLANMAIQVSTANVSYQAALQTTASIRQMSLLNFLR